jgi:hypothetical protein
MNPGTLDNRNDRFWQIVLKKSVAQLFGMLEGTGRA